MEIKIRCLNINMKNAVVPKMVAKGVVRVGFITEPPNLDVTYTSEKFHTSTPCLFVPLGQTQVPISEVIISPFHPYFACL